MDPPLAQNAQPPGSFTPVRTTGGLGGLPGARCLSVLPIPLGRAATAAGFSTKECRGGGKPHPCRLPVCGKRRRFL